MNTTATKTQNDEPGDDAAGLLCLSRNQGDAKDDADQTVKKRENGRCRWGLRLGFGDHRGVESGGQIWMEATATICKSIG